MYRNKNKNNSTDNIITQIVKITKQRHVQIMKSNCTDIRIKKFVQIIGSEKGDPDPK